MASTAHPPTPSQAFVRGIAIAVVCIGSRALATLEGGDRKKKKTKLDIEMSERRLAMDRTSKKKLGKQRKEIEEFLKFVYGITSCNSVPFIQDS
jgi:septal ring factor EnvC (AmiA/AmiB activator)